MRFAILAMLMCGGSMALSQSAQRAAPAQSPGVRVFTPPASMQFQMCEQPKGTPMAQNLDQACRFLPTAEPKAQLLPIPTTAPNAKLEQIPTTWSKLTIQPVESGAAANVKK